MIVSVPDLTGLLLAVCADGFVGYHNLPSRPSSVLSWRAALLVSCLNRAPRRISIESFGAVVVLGYGVSSSRVHVTLDKPMICFYACGGRPAGRWIPTVPGVGRPVGEMARSSILQGAATTAPPVFLARH